MNTKAHVTRNEPSRVELSSSTHSPTVINSGHPTSTLSTTPPLNSPSQSSIAHRLPPRASSPLPSLVTAHEQTAGSISPTSSPATSISILQQPQQSQQQKPQVQQQVDEDLANLSEYTFSSFGFTPDTPDGSPQPRNPSVVVQHSKTGSTMYGNPNFPHAPPSTSNNVPDTLQGPVHTHTDTDELRVLRGRIEHRPWSKTEESFRAGGSDYFALLPEDSSLGDSIILRIDRLRPPLPSLADHAASADERVSAMRAELIQAAQTHNIVTIEGNDRTETLTVPTSEMDPHPMGYTDTITTHTFVVRRLVPPREPAKAPVPPPQNHDLHHDQEHQPEQEHTQDRVHPRGHGGNDQDSQHHPHIQEMPEGGGSDHDGTQQSAEASSHV